MSQPYTIPTTRQRVLSPLLGIACTLALSCAAVAAIAMGPDLLTAPGATAPAPAQAVPAQVGEDASEAGYPKLGLDDEGNPIAHWFFDEGVRDNVWYNVFF